MPPGILQRLEHVVDRAEPAADAFGRRDVAGHHAVARQQLLRGGGRPFSGRHACRAAAGRPATSGLRPTAARPAGCGRRAAARPPPAAGGVASRRTREGAQRVKRVVGDQRPSRPDPTAHRRSRRDSRRRPRGAGRRRTTRRAAARCATIACSRGDELARRRRRVASAAK